MRKPLFKILEITVLGIATLIGCAQGSTDSAPTSVGGVAVGGYIGLGKYTGISGTYGNAIVSPSGGASNAGLGGASQEGVSSTGGAVVATGGVTTATGSDNGTGAAASPTGGVTWGGASSVTQGGATGGRAAGAGSSGGASTSGTVSRGSASTGGAASHGGASTGGAASSGSAALGGASTGGAASSGSAALGGASTGGSVAVGGAAAFAWPGTYNPSGTASDATGRHNQGVNCLSSSCHASTQTTRAFAFGGTVYQSGGANPAANVEVAITSGTTTVTTYSATNGNFWVPLTSAPSISWANATVHLRNATGEVSKPVGTSVAAGCNSCHGPSMRIVGP